MKSYFVKIRCATWQRLRDLQQVYGLDVFGRSARKVPEDSFEIQGLLSEDQIRRIQADGYEVKIMKDADQLARDRLTDVGRHDPNSTV